MSSMTFDQLNQVFTVETLMTPRAVCRLIENTMLGQPLAEELASFDILPVIEDGQVIGVYAQASGQFLPLAERWLVSRDTPIPDLITLFIQTGNKAFLVIHGQQVVGIVSPADLNKMPMRVYAYHVIGNLEMALAKLIRGHFSGDDEGLLQSLTDKRQEELKTYVEESRRDNLNVDLVEYLFLSELVKVIIDTDVLHDVFGCKSKTQVKKKFGGLVKLRNKVMHAVKPLLSKEGKGDGISPEKLKTYIDRAREIVDMLEQYDVKQKE